MNNVFSLYKGSLPRFVVCDWFVKAANWFWGAADLGPIVTFTTGVIVGVLIPSGDWPAIVTVIVIGAVLQRIVKAIDGRAGRA